MKRFTAFSFGATLISVVSVPSLAQSGPVAQQSSEQLVCQFSGDCAQAMEGTEDKPESRGFSIAKPTLKVRPAPASPFASSAATSRPAAVRAKPVASRLARSNTGVAINAAVATSAVAMRPGRADLLISFVMGSDALTDQAMANSQEFVKALNSPKLAAMKFAIEGHTDAVGARDYNLDLSQRRAQAVVNYLVESGIDRSRFQVKGYGFDRPFDGLNARDGRNRRVEAIKAN